MAAMQLSHLRLSRPRGGWRRGPAATIARQRERRGVAPDPAYGAEGRSVIEDDGDNAIAKL
jgi:hypothetical protein